MKHPSETVETKSKRLLFRSKHRGTKEMDILLGGYYEENMQGFSEQQLSTFEGLLNEPDDDLYAWALGREAVPSEIDSDVLRGFIDSVRRRGGGSSL